MTIPNIFFIYFSRILDKWACIIFNSTPFSHLCLWTGPEEHKYAKHVSIVNWVGVGGAYSTASPENLSNTYRKKSAKRWRVRGRFLMCSPTIDRYRLNTCENFKMINTIAGEHIPVSIKLNNVYARYRLDCGQTSPGIFIPLKCVNNNFLKVR